MQKSRYTIIYLVPSFRLSARMSPHIRFPIANLGDGRTNRSAQSIGRAPVVVLLWAPVVRRKQRQYRRRPHNKLIINFGGLHESRGQQASQKNAALPSVDVKPIPSYRLIQITFCLSLTPSPSPLFFPSLSTPAPRPKQNYVSPATVCDQRVLVAVLQPERVGGPVCRHLLRRGSRRVRQRRPPAQLLVRSVPAV